MTIKVEKCDRRDCWFAHDGGFIPCGISGKIIAEVWDKNSRHWFDNTEKVQGISGKTPFEAMFRLKQLRVAQRQDPHTGG